MGLNPRRAIIPDNTILLVYSVAPFNPDLYPLRGLCLALMTNIYCAWKISKCINHCQTLHLESTVFSHHHAVTIQKSCSTNFPASAFSPLHWRNKECDQGCAGKGHQHTRLEELKANHLSLEINNMLLLFMWRGRFGYTSFWLSHQQIIFLCTLFRYWILNVKLSNVLQNCSD